MSGSRKQILVKSHRPVFEPFQFEFFKFSKKFPNLNSHIFGTGKAAGMIFGELEQLFELYLNIEKKFEKLKIFWSGVYMVTFKGVPLLQELKFF